MRVYFVFAIAAICSQLGVSQNIDYESRITQFYGSNCGNDSGFITTEEHTWKGWLRDNVNTVETYSGCIQRNFNGAVTQTGTYAIRNRNNISATQFVARIDAWEDDTGSRCDYNTGFNSDDCRANTSSTFNLSNPLEYQWTVNSQTVGSTEYNMDVFYQYRYSTTTLPLATEYTGSAFTTGGNRPFWGCRGSWAFSGSDCAASGTIGNNQTSSFSTTVDCRSQVRFRWRVESEANFDWLEVYVNGVRRDRISGTVGWTLMTLPLDYGSNTIEWRYVKDGSTSVGLDRGFVDQISFTNALSVDPGTISGDETFNVIGDPSNIVSTADAQSYSASLNYQWQYSNNGITGWVNIGGATDYSYNPPAGLNTTRYYRRRVQDGCGNTDYSNIILKEMLPRFVYESGSWNPHDPGGLTWPNSNASHTVIVRESTTQTNSFTAGILAIDPGVTFTATGDVGIDVISQVQLNGILDLGENGQLLQSNSSSLIAGASGALRKTREGNPNLYRYTYWGSPVSTSGTSSNAGFDIASVMKDGTTGVPRNLNFTPFNIADGIPGDAVTAATISGRWLYAFRDQPSNYSNWESINSGTLLLSGQGFTMKGTLTATGVQPFVFEGIPNNGTINLNITSGNDYLISNPYPSAIDAHQFLLDNPNLDGTLYFWEHYGGDTHLLSGYQGGYATYNFSGGVGAPALATPATGVDTGGTPTKIPGRYIPVAQGFFVQATATGSLGFNNNQRIFITELPGQSVFVKSSNTPSQPIEDDLRTKIRLGMTNPDYGHRQLLLTVDPAASYDVDKYYDGPSYELLSNDIAFYLDNQHYAIQGIPSINSNDEIPLVIDIADSGMYSIGLDQLENWDDNLDVYLYDNISDTYYDLRLANAEITLSPNQYIGRFSLKFSNLSLSTVTNEAIENVLTVYQPTNRNRIVIQLSSERYRLEKVNLFDINGGVVLNVSSNGLLNRDNRWLISTEGVATGAYILQMKINGIYHTRKLVIK